MSGVSGGLGDGVAPPFAPGQGPQYVFNPLAATPGSDGSPGTLQNQNVLSSGQIGLWRLCSLRQKLWIL